MNDEFTPPKKVRWTVKMMVRKRIVFSTMEILVSMLVGWGCILGVLFLGEVWGMLSCGEL